MSNSILRNHESGELSKMKLECSAKVVRTCYICEQTCERVYALVKKNRIIQYVCSSRCHLAFYFNTRIRKINSSKDSEISGLAKKMDEVKISINNLPGSQVPHVSAFKKIEKREKS